MTKARDISSLIGSSGQIDNTKITLDTNEIPNLDAGKITSGSLGADRIPNLSADKITSGTFSDARIAASNVSQHATSFDDNKLVNDISTLALRQASDQNKSSYNTNSQSVDVFQDDTGIDTTTNTGRNASEYVSSVVNTQGSQSYFTTSDVYLNSSYMTIDDVNQTPNTSRFHFNSHGSGSGNWCMFSKQAVLTGDFEFEYATHSHGYNNVGEPNDNLWFQFGFTHDNSDLTTGNSIYNRANDNGAVGLWYATQGNGKPYNNVYYGNGSTVTQQYSGGSGASLSTNQVVKWTRTGSTFKLYTDGTLRHTETTYTSSADMYAMVSSGYNPAYQLANSPKFLRVNYTPTTLTTSATGNFTGTTITAPSSVSSMGAIITYQDQAGTNALNTDIVLQLSADGGSNYSTATLTALPDFSTGIKMAKVNDLAVTAGTQLKYKINFANQASGSKEARIRGVALQY